MRARCAGRTLRAMVTKFMTEDRSDGLRRQAAHVAQRRQVDTRSAPARDYSSTSNHTTRRSSP
jgi:hypothetical protein